MIKARPMKVNVRLSPTYENVIKFNTLEEKLNYFEDLEPGFFEALELSPNINFNIGDGLHTSIKLDRTNFGADLNTALSCNYLIVKTVENASIRYYFYFITVSNPINVNTVMYTLELDVMTTYSINTDYKIKNFMVERAHLDRFGEQMGEGYEFDLSKGNLIHNAEPIASTYNTTYPVERINLQLDNQNIKSGSEENYYKKVKGWLVCFISGGTTLIYSEKGGNYILPFTTLTAPVWTDSHHHFFINYNNVNSWFEASHLYEYLCQGTKKDQIYGFTFIDYCPFIETADAHKFYYSEQNFYYNSLLEPYYPPSITPEIPEQTIVAAYQLNALNENILSKTFTFNILNDFQILKNDEINKTLEKKEKLEPKLLQSPFTSINIKKKENEGLEINLFDACDTQIKGKIIEFPSAEGTKIFTTCINNDSYYEQADNVGYGKTDISVCDLPVVDDAYLNYVRNNKNSLITGLAIPAAATTVGAFGFGASIYDKYKAANTPQGLTPSTGLSWSNLPVQSVLNGLSSVTPFVGMGVGAAATVTNYVANLNNLKNTPDSLKNNVSNTGLNILKGEPLPFVEISQLRDNEKTQVFEYFYKYGYNVQIRMDSNDNRIFCRYIFNYLKSLEDVTDKIESVRVFPLIVKQKISDILLKGCTFWNPDSGHLFNLNFENFENRLLNENQ